MHGAGAAVRRRSSAICPPSRSVLLSTIRRENSNVRQRPWEADILKSCAERKQVRVSLESVIDVSTGQKPWRQSFGQANPQVQPGPELEFARPACNSYVSNAERRRTAEGQLQSAQYLHRELPVRLAYAITAMNEMEDTGLTGTRPADRVRESYLQGFREVHATQRPHDRDSVKAFTKTVERVQERGADTVLLMACGLQDMMRCRTSDPDQAHSADSLGEEDKAGLKRVQDFMDKFYQNRVAMRFLCGHYLALSSPPRKGFVGLVQQGVSLTNIAQVAAMEAASICCHALGACPEVRMKVDSSGDGLVATVPEYVHYVVLELLKNAMRATMKAHGGKDVVAAQGVDASAKENSSLQERAGGAKGGAGDSAGGGSAPIVFADVPEVTISVTTEGEDDIVLVVSDQGGGIPAEATDKVWSYLYTTAGDAVRSAYLADGGNSPSKPAPLAGLGYGLPLSRLYARNFGGELKLRSVVGQGTDATLCLSRHGTKLEPLVWPKTANWFDELDSQVHL